MTNFFLLRSMRLMVTTLFASLSACFASAASALAVFFWASLAARFWASTEREAVAASRASVIYGALVRHKCSLICFGRLGVKKAGGRRTGRPDPIVHLLVVALEPFLALPHGAAIFAVLQAQQGVLVSFLGARCA